MISRLLCLCALAVAAAGATAAEMPYGVLDITLGASFARLQRDLDFRDIDAALAKSGKPDFGRRGYGCMARDDDFADTACVSHAERLNDIETREIRLHFLEGRLQQFSLTAEIQHYAAVIGYLRARYGAPQTLPAANAGGEPRLQWQSEAARVDAYRGKDLVFVNFESMSYPAAMQRKRDGKRLLCD
jgi:hypothetical protein